ncbi:hypothetical protein [Rouxiella sp. Mn2063]|uniref:hypothetical protein n=1 Tax=Rouxiella sp. Mn2063 TaxID=3395262 RepID=UPI003BBE9D9B
MNLRKIANSATRKVNPNITVELLKYDGQTMGQGRKPIPSYTTHTGISIQLQPLSGDDLKHIDGLNIQGLIKSIHVNGSYFSVQREKEQGGDIFIIGDEQWLVVKPVELWPDWCRLIVNLQVT